MKFNMKNLMDEAKDVGAMVGGMVASRKFLDPDELFKKKIAADATFKDGILYKHFGAAKFGAAFLAKETFGKKLPAFAKLMLVGVMIDGALTEVGQITTNKDGKRMFPMGNNNNKNYNNAAMDELLRKAIMQSRERLQGPVVDQYPSSVAGGGSDLDRNASSGVAGMGMKFQGFNKI